MMKLKKINLWPIIMMQLSNYSLLFVPTTLQLFDEMPMCQVVICNVITTWCAYKGPDVVDFDLSQSMNRMFC
jgi:hypothetical protein